MMLPRHHFGPTANKGHHPSRDHAIVSKDNLFKLSLVLNLFCLLQYFFMKSNGDKSLLLRGDEMTWHGGHPVAQEHSGSCWCGAEDHYCMCTPNLAIDLVIATHDDSHIWLVQRKDTNQLATMGGFVDVAETPEQAVHRELQEEMGIVLDPTQEQPQLLGVYSDPKRDNRRRTVSVVYVVRLSHSIEPKAADDVKDVRKISLDKIEDHEYFADHKTILLDYRQSLTSWWGTSHNRNSSI
jgi:8-oxo-dGTP diphosphatase